MWLWRSEKCPSCLSSLHVSVHSAITGKCVLQGSYLCLAVEEVTVVVRLKIIHYCNKFENI